MTVIDIQTLDWWCNKHQCSKEITLENGRWIVICKKCKEEYSINYSNKTEDENING